MIIIPHQTSEDGEHTSIRLPDGDEVQIVWGREGEIKHCLWAPRQSVACGVPRCKVCGANHVIGMDGKYLASSCPDDHEREVYRWYQANGFDEVNLCSNENCPPDWEDAGELDLDILGINILNVCDCGKVAFNWSYMK